MSHFVVYVFSKENGEDVEEVVCSHQRKRN